MDGSDNARPEPEDRPRAEGEVAGLGRRRSQCVFARLPCDSFYFSADCP
jgi:hypothetical protein